MAFEKPLGRLGKMVNNCSKIVCVGRNYADHIKELKNATPSRPFFFLKPQSSLLVPRQGAVRRPRGVKLDYEIELGCIIGKEIKNLAADDEEKAYDSIKQYVLAIDMTARNVQDECRQAGLPWTIAKGFDTFCPVSWPLARNQIVDPHDVVLSLAVNGEQKQYDNTNLMLYKIPRLLSEISSVMRLVPGDIVLTGTPKGVGEVKHNDCIEACLKREGKTVERSRIRVMVVDSDAGYEHSPD